MLLSSSRPHHRAQRSWRGRGGSAVKNQEKKHCFAQTTMCSLSPTSLWRFEQRRYKVEACTHRIPTHTDRQTSSRKDEKFGSTTRAIWPHLCRARPHAAWGPSSRRLLSMTPEGKHLVHNWAGLPQPKSSDRRNENMAGTNLDENSVSRVGALPGQPAKAQCTEATHQGKSRTPLTEYATNNLRTWPGGTKSSPAKGGKETNSGGCAGKLTRLHRQPSKNVLASKLPQRFRVAILSEVSNYQNRSVTKQLAL